MATAGAAIPIVAIERSFSDGDLVGQMRDHRWRDVTEAVGKTRMKPIEAKLCREAKTT